tara:strand:- start:745 stop:1260 length:516 start_codon:yes stop_codon:yes gene_type:complete
MIKVMKLKKNSKKVQVEKILKTKSLILLFIMGLLVLSSCDTGNSSWIQDNTGAIVYKSPTCGCCGGFSQYMTTWGFDVEIVDTVNLDAIKEEYGIPINMKSCHTTLIGDYFVEGHVPSEAIEKLLVEKPDIAGIALPGMPAGSPGMGGSKNVPWIVYAINYDGSYEEFMRI